MHIVTREGKGDITTCCFYLMSLELFGKVQPASSPWNCSGAYFPPS
jgi:hypothetical protein